MPLVAGKALHRVAARAPQAAEHIVMSVENLHGASLVGLSLGAGAGKEKRLLSGGARRDGMLLPDLRCC
ncbi:hypothetical protein MASR1M49_14950 [Pararhodobacter aggregans]